MSWTRLPGATPPEISLGRSRRGPTPLARAVVAAVALGFVVLEVAAALSSGDRRDQLTAAAVLALAATGLLHAALRRGPLWALGLAVLCLGVGLGAEALNEATGVPFGDRTFAGTGLGSTLLDVPVLVPLLWLGLGYPALLVARRLAARRLPQVLLGTLALGASDLLLDPILVQAGHWSWQHPAPHLPHVPTVPLSRYAGWLLVSAVLMVLLSLLPQRRADDRVPLLLWLWLWLSSVLGAAVLLDHPMAALWGGAALGLVGIPLVLAMTAAPPP